MKKSVCKHDWIDITRKDGICGNTYLCYKCEKIKFVPYKKKGGKS